MKTKFQKKYAGFTIIEVIIVLAIAALILLVVFLAVPALQRSQRNNARKSDTSRVAASVIEYATNNSTGSLPADTTGCKSLVKSVGSLSQYTLDANCTSSVVAGLSSATAADTFYIATNGVGTAPTAASNILILAEAAQCKANVNDTTVSAGAKQAAMLYTRESGSTWDWSCLNVQ